MLWFDIICGFLLSPLLIYTTAWAISRLAPLEQSQEAVLAEWPWLAKGVLAPFLIWIVMNLGLSFQFHAFMPAIQAAQNANAPWFPIFLRVIAGGLLQISSYWAALTVVWWLLRAYRRITPEADLEFRAVCFTSTAIMILPAAALVYYGGWSHVGLAVLLFALPMIGYGSPLLQRPKPRPMYSRAMARLKRGQYSDAEKEILRQLEKSETDFDGWLMLAELHATRFGELAEAEQIILDTCLHPEATPSQISVALHKLADWQIQVAHDPEAAARSLQLISDRLPGTHLATMAELRRAKLPSNDEFLAQREAKPIPVPVIPSMFALTESPAPLLADPAPALAQIQKLTEALTRDPNNIGDREQLARLLAEPLGKAEAAIEQIELLLGIPDQPEARRLSWLTLIAGWQLQLLNDETAAHATLARLVAEFPATPQAFAAQRRLSLSKARTPSRRD